ncbi:translesion DNA synthesis-associated protein ImuA [Hylemonella gracilis]|uniref:Translesion DNA synthesis-associated protein ImuA n=2 Tax=Hylemonella gracilis TaxID=80880 RepID=A0A4P6UME3_9BURK|nr:translesion DNA synthesis-associated protein ImuA [Hylemonella gracilis]
MGIQALVSSQVPSPRLAALDGVWRAAELARVRQTYVPSGHGELDPELPGQGWPLGQLTEILQAQPGLHEWRLLLSALRQAVAHGPLVLVGAPQLPNLPVLSLLGIPARQLLRVDAHSAAERLWATEQVLRGRELGALLSWLPRARPEQLRRLQLASTATQALVFALRPIAARHESSPAPLRLTLQAAPQGAEGGRRGSAWNCSSAVVPPWTMPSRSPRRCPSRPRCAGVASRRNPLMLWCALRPRLTPGTAPSSPSPHEPPPGPEQQALAWWALQFSPRVCMLEEAVLLEVQASLRLYGGRRALLHRLRAALPEAEAAALAVAPTALAALALLRTVPQEEAALDAQAVPAVIPAVACATRHLSSTLDALPLLHLSAARAHAPVLARLGCRTLGQLRALPRDGVSRRFGAALLEALDRAYGQRPEAQDWIALPERFSARLEFTGRVETAEGLLFGARRLLGQLVGWLQARQRGVLAFTLHWEHDLVRRGELRNGQLDLRTGAATRDTRHLARLLGEHLARIQLPAPVQAIRLDATETEAFKADNTSLLPGDVKDGEPLAQLIERLAARLGPHRVLRGRVLADHRPQHMQAWFAASEPAAKTKTATPALPPHLRLHPAWILREPLRLDMQGDRPLYQGPLRMLAGPERLETGWWSFSAAAEVEGEELALRDYYVARSPQAGLLWVYRRRGGGELAWFLQGIYG